MAGISLHNIAVGSILCDDIMSEHENMKMSCNLILAGWHPQERDIFQTLF